MLRRVLANKPAAVMLMRNSTFIAARAEKPDAPIYRNYESTVVTDQRRFEDEPEPTEDD